jgi:hypothetical protein
MLRARHLFLKTIICFAGVDSASPAHLEGGLNDDEIRSVAAFARLKAWRKEDEKGVLFLDHRRLLTSELLLRSSSFF